MLFHGKLACGLFKATKINITAIISIMKAIVLEHFFVIMFPPQIHFVGSFATPSIANLSAENNQCFMSVPTIQTAKGRVVFFRKGRENTQGKILFYSACLQNGF